MVINLCVVHRRNITSHSVTQLPHEVFQITYHPIMLQLLIDTLQTYGHKMPGMVVGISTVSIQLF